MLLEGALEELISSSSEPARVAAAATPIPAATLPRQRSSSRSSSVPIANSVAVSIATADTDSSQSRSSVATSGSRCSSLVYEDDDGDRVSGSNSNGEEETSWMSSSTLQLVFEGIDDDNDDEEEEEEEEEEERSSDQSSSASSSSASSPDGAASPISILHNMPLISSRSPMAAKLSALIARKHRLSLPSKTAISLVVSKARSFNLTPRPSPSSPLDSIFPLNASSSQVHVSKPVSARDSYSARDQFSCCSFLGFIKTSKRKSKTITNKKIPKATEATLDNINIVPKENKATISRPLKQVSLPTSRIAKGSRPSTELIPPWELGHLQENCLEKFQYSNSRYHESCGGGDELGGCVELTEQEELEEPYSPIASAFLFRHPHDNHIPDPPPFRRVRFNLDRLSANTTSSCSMELMMPKNGIDYLDQIISYVNNDDVIEILNHNDDDDDDVAGLPSLPDPDHHVPTTHVPTQAPQTLPTH